MENNPAKSDLPDLVTQLAEVPEEQMPTDSAVYTKPFILCTLAIIITVFALDLLGLVLEPKILATFAMVMGGLVYCVVKVQPNTEEARDVLDSAKNAIQVSATFDIKVVRFQYSSTTYYNFTIENKEVGYKTKAAACHLTIFARELLESHLEGDDVSISEISNVVTLSDITLVANPESTKNKPLILLIWRGHLIWCKAENDFSLEAIQFKK